LWVGATFVGAGQPFLEGLVEAFDPALTSSTAATGQAGSSGLNRPGVSGDSIF
jgi:hypothetical protein